VGGKMLHAKPRRDTLANLMLLTRSENSAKNDEIPTTWLAKQTQEFRDKHWIPSDRRLWELENYEEFLEARLQLLLTHMRSIGLVESQVTSE
jgi:hypothetical protein